MLKVFQDVETAPAYASFDDNVMSPLQYPRPPASRVEAVLLLDSVSIMPVRMSVLL
jgi:hypothetical protein